MDVTTGNSHSNEMQPLESAKSAEEGKQATGKDVSTSLFVNHAAAAWHENRRKWVGDQTQRSQKTSKEEIISWSTAYEDLLSSNEPFSEPIPLTGGKKESKHLGKQHYSQFGTWRQEMVDFLVDIWHSEELLD